jgi:hypothetical protein
LKAAIVDMVKIEDKKFELLKEYARNYDGITDEQADTYIYSAPKANKSTRLLDLY